MLNIYLTGIQFLLFIFFLPLQSVCWHSMHSIRCSSTFNIDLTKVNDIPQKCDNYKIQLSLSVKCGCNNSTNGKEKWSLVYAILQFLFNGIEFYSTLKTEKNDVQKKVQFSNQATKQNRKMWTHFNQMFNIHLNSDYSHKHCVCRHRDLYRKVLFFF